jgi:hypothetical protein
MQDTTILIEEAAEQLCKVWGVHPDAWISRRDASRHTGVSTVTFEQRALKGTGPAYKVALGRAVMKARDVARWWLSQLRDPSEGQQARGVQTTRERHGRLGRLPKHINETIAA